MFSKEADALYERLIARLAVDHGGDPDWFRPDKPDEVKRAHYLAQLRGLAALRDAVESTIDATGRHAIARGASYSTAGHAAGFTKQRAHQRFRIPPEWADDPHLPSPVDDDARAAYLLRHQPTDAEHGQWELLTDEADVWHTSWHTAARVEGGDATLPAPIARWAAVLIAEHHGEQVLDWQPRTAPDGTRSWAAVLAGDTPTPDKENP